MTFQELNAALIPSAETLCAQLLPGGKREGREWIAGSTQGEAGRSLKVVLDGPKAGMWKDFASDEGGDLLKLIERTKKTDPKGAADFARSFLGLPGFAPNPDLPPPFNPLKFGFKRKDETNWRYGTAAWAYRDASGMPTCWVVRFDHGDGKKDIMPIRLLEGKPRWRGFTGNEMRPLYNLHKLAQRPDATVLVVEGEKTADAAQAMFPAYVAITWMGGSGNVAKADWSPLLDRKSPVVLWADADKPGRKAMAYLAQLIEGSKRVRTAELPEGWDLADPLPEDVNPQAMVDRAMLGDPEAEERKKKAAEKEAKEGETKYILPRGCRLADVQADIDAYGLFEYAGKVWSVWQANGQRGKYADEISNFTCQINAHIELPDNQALKLITIRNIYGEQFTYHVSGDAVLTLPTFRKVTAGDKGNFDWNATDHVYRHYLRRMQDNMGRGRIIRELGMQPEGFFVMSNMVLNQSVVPIDEQGCFDHGKVRYYVPAARQVRGKDRGAFVNARLVRYMESEITWQQLTAKLRQVHRQHAFMALTFAVGSIFRDIIHARLGGFPLLFLFGEPGSGKDQCIDACRSITGKPQPTLPLTGNNTGPGMVNMFAEMSCIPQCFGEWKNDMKMELQEMVFAIWQGQGRRRGTKSQDVSAYATDSVPIECTAYVTGNDYPNVEEKGMTRFIIDEMNKDTFNADELKHYSELQDMMIEGYSHLLAPIVAARQDFKEQWYGTYYKQAQGIITEKLNGTVIHGRMHQNISTLLSVFLFFEERLQWAWTRQELVDHMVACTLVQSKKRNEGDPVSDFWTCFITAKRKHQIQEDAQFRIEGNRLTFFWEEIHAIYEETYRTLGRRKPPLNSTTLLGKLKKHPCFIETLGTHYIGGRRSRAQAFDMDRSGTALRGLLKDATNDPMIDPVTGQLSDASGLPF